MKLETFFEKFDRFADAPDAVAKMRELVLLLAVQGKLVDQLPSDEPATKLLERIQKSKERLIKERAIRRQETDPIDCDSAPFPIPTSWVWTRLGEIGDWGSGSTPPRGNHDLYDGGITWLKSGELNDNQALAGSSETVTELALKTGSFRRNQPGDVLFAMYGATIGKVAILAEPAVTNQAVCGCTPFEGVSNRYLFNYLVSQRAAFHKASEGGAQPNLSKVKIVAFPIPLPPLAEQKRIVAKVDELMALCDRLEAQEAERQSRHGGIARASLARFADAPTPANLQFLFHSSFSIHPSDLRKSILTLAVQGKLVPQDPNDEPAEELLERVASALPDKKSENPFLGEIEPTITDESEYELPPGWAWLPLGHVGIWATGCGFPMQYQGETAGEFLFCKVSDMNLPGNEVEIHTTVHKIDADVMKKIRARANPVGTVIFPKIGGAIATHKRRLVIKPTIIDNNCSGIQPIGLTDDSWLLLFLRNLDLTKYQSGTSVPAVSQSSLDPIRIGLPPLAEQRRIVAKVEQLMALVDALDKQLAASRDTAANLLSALVAELAVSSSKPLTAA